MKLVTHITLSTKNCFTFKLTMYLTALTSDEFVTIHYRSHYNGVPHSEAPQKSADFNVGNLELNRLYNKGRRYNL